MDQQQLTEHICAGTVSEGNKDNFENWVLSCVDRSPAFYQRTKGVLCASTAAHPKPYEDFSRGWRRSVYTILALHHDQQTHTGRDYVPMEPERLKFMLQTLSTNPEHLALGLSNPDTGNLWYIDAVDTLVQERSKPLDSLLKLVDMVFDYWLQKQRVQSTAAEFTKNGDAWNPMELTKQLHSAVYAATSAGGFGIKRGTMHARSDNGDNAERYPCSLSGLNVGLGGGFAKGEAYMFIAPPGAGKTIIATQLSLELVMNPNFHGLFISTEQTPTALLPRYVSNYCDIPYGRVNGIRQANLVLNAKQQERYDQLFALWDRLDFLHWTDTQGDGLLNRLESFAVYAKNHGNPYDFIILDWVGGALGSQSLSSNRSDIVRRLFQETADMMAHVALAHNLIGIYTAQANPKQAENKREVTQSMVAECKTMGTKATAVIGISALKEQAAMGEKGGNVVYSNLQVMYMDKSRHCTGNRMYVSRDFEYQRFGDSNDARSHAFKN